MKKTVIGLAMMVLFSTIACNRAERALKSQIRQRQTEMSNKFHSMMKDWLGKMVKTMPKERTKASLLKWRLDAIAFQWGLTMNKVIAGSRGLIVNKEYKSIQDYLQEMTDYWQAINPNNANKKNVKVKDFIKAVTKLKKNVKDPMVLAMADFDMAFLHLLAFYGAKKYNGVQRSTYLFKYWQLAFAFPRGYESIDGYIRRLCKEKIPEFCSKQPFETLSIALNRPYYEKVRGLVADFAKKHPKCKLGQVFNGFDKELADAQKAIPEFKEIPVLADTVSKDDFTSNLEFLVTKGHGIIFNGKGETPNVVLLSPAQTKNGVNNANWSVFAKKLSVLLKMLDQKRGPENMEWALLVINKDMPVSMIMRFVNIMAKSSPRYLSIAGRRHKEGIAKAAKVGKLVFREVPIKPMSIAAKGHGILKCMPLGQSNTDPRMDHRLKSILLITKGSQYMGTLEKGSAVGLKELQLNAAAEAVRKNTAKNIATLITINKDVSVDRLVALLTALGYKCRDKECAKVKTFKYDAQFEVCSSH